MKKYLFNFNPDDIEALRGIASKEAKENGENPERALSRKLREILRAYLKANTQIIK